MKIYVKTRGTSVDYRFLGAVPSGRWWEALSGRYLTEERPAVAVRGEGTGWSAALFGVASSRRDARPRTIRYSLIIEGGSRDAQLAVQLVRLGLDAAARADLGARLDEIYPAELVDAALETPAEAELPNGERVLAVLREAASKMSAEAAARPVGAPWAGPASEPRAVETFIAHAAGLAQGEHGLCFTSGSLSTLEQARRAAARISDEGGDEIGVLVHGAQFEGVQSLRDPMDPRRLIGDGAGWGVSGRTAASVSVGLATLAALVWMLRKA